MFTPTHIVVVESGWVFAAVLEDITGDIRASECAVIRSWGTTDGLALTTTDGDGWVIHILITAAIAA